MLPITMPAKSIVTKLEASGNHGDSGYHIVKTSNEEHKR